MKVEVTFRCRKCGLETPGRGELDASIPDRQRVQVFAECFHCHAPLQRIIRAGELRAKNGVK